MITKNGLHFDVTATDEFVCRELQELPDRFAARWSESDVDAMVASFVDHIKGAVEKRYPTKEEHDKVPKEERHALGLPLLEAILSTVDTSAMTVFQKFMFWMSCWWYYDVRIREQVYFDLNKAHDACHKRLTEFVMPALPDVVREAVASMEVIGVAAGFGHFAILFNNKEKSVRRIVTDTQLFELRDVRGYNYLDVTPDGKPFTRCVTGRGGGRAFFDGVRLMAHDSFETCAPKVSFFDGGYKVNSTKVTIVNGMLLPLIEEQDAVAHTNGAFFGEVSFSNAQAIESYRLSDETAKRLRMDGGAVRLGDRALKPMGVFAKSRQSLLENGFVLCDFSDFHETNVCVYDHLMVVDDKAEWVEAVAGAFSDVERIDRVLTGNAEEALSAIVESKPEAVLLDIHLTGDERFEGLWIAREAKKRGFKGRILIASNYNDHALEAMSVLTGGLEAPGKNLDRIKKLLASRR